MLSYYHQYEFAFTRLKLYRITTMSIYCIMHVCILSQNELVFLNISETCQKNALNSEVCLFSKYLPDRILGQLSVLILLHFVQILLYFLTGHEYLFHEI